ncbi:MAG: hypothetical protein JRN54_05720, partial [Nitrososphaerota archaeon]|nr:hypothetical protein [Nitrososphaerota archaeon]
MYHSESRTKIANGNILITSEDYGRNGGRTVRLREDVTSLLYRSGFHISESARSEGSLEIVLGKVNPQTEGEHLYADYSGWRAHVGSKPPTGVEDIPVVNPVMSLFVAGLVVSEAFRRLLGDATALRPSDGWVGDLPMTEALTPLPMSLDFQGQRVAWIGCGSISFAALRALDTVRQVKGTLNLVDPANLNRSNCKKYLGPSKLIPGKGKARTMASLLRSRGIAATPFKGSLNDYGRHTRFEIPLAICAADSSVTRRDLQAKLPKAILNAWTGSTGTSLLTGVSRHSFDGVEECLNCAYWEDVE